MWKEASLIFLGKIFVWQNVLFELELSTFYGHFRWYAVMAKKKTTTTSVQGYQVIGLIHFHCKYLRLMFLFKKRTDKYTSGI